MGSFRYKVFLSFYGDDVRYTFASHLYKELFRKSVYTFKDDEKFERGNNISVILDAIQDSRSALIVLSPNYAKSIWCLEELSKIMECRVKVKQIVVPIFYQIDPSELTDPGGSYEAALRTHQAEFAEKFSGDEKKLKEAMHKLQRWREDLKQVPDISGWVSQNEPRSETHFIEKIVDDINDRLVCQSSSDAEILVGMSKHVNELNRLLEIKKENVVRWVGISGIEGIGKKTIARVIFNNLFHHFNGGCVLPNVGRRIREHRISELKEELVSKTLGEQKSILWPVDRDSKIIEDMLGFKKVLIVLEDVDGYNQLEYLVKPGWFKLGSRIIITAQDKQFLTAAGVEPTYEVPYLDDEPACRLFCQYAFRTKQPKEGYWEPLSTFLSKVKGFPFALIMLGRFLHGKSPEVWNEELEKEPNEHPSMEIQDIMKRCYTCLSPKERDAFLDIACFFNGENKQFVSDILGGCGFGANATLRVLEDKALITTSGNKVFMHKLLQDMGRENVRKESVKLVERSRLWNFKDIDPVLSIFTEDGDIEGIFFNTAKRGDIKIHSDGFMGLGKLRLLKLYNSLHQKCNVQVDSLSSISKLLRLFHWPEFPLEFLPEEFCPKHLVVLNLPGSKIRKLWSGQQSLEKLLSVDLGHSGLTELPNLSKAENLKTLNLQGCTDLVDVSSIEHLTKVEYLNFGDCKQLRDLPDMKKLASLRELKLSNCSRLEKIGQLPASVKYLYLRGTAIKEFSVPTDCELSLEELETSDCPKLETLPPQISETKSIKIFNVANSPHLVRKLCGVKTDIPNKEEEEKTVTVGVGVETCGENFHSEVLKSQVGSMHPFGTSSFSPDHEVGDSRTVITSNDEETTEIIEGTSFYLCNQRSLRMAADLERVSSTDTLPSSAFGAHSGIAATVTDASTSTRANFDHASTKETTTSSNNRSLEESKLLPYSLGQNPLVAGLDADVNDTSVPPTYPVIESLSNPETNSISVKNTPISIANKTIGTKSTEIFNVANSPHLVRKLCEVGTDIPKEEEEEKAVGGKVEMSGENFHSKESKSPVNSAHALHTSSFFRDQELGHSLPLITNKDEETTEFNERKSPHVCNPSSLTMAADLESLSSTEPLPTPAFGVQRGTLIESDTSTGTRTNIDGASTEKTPTSSKKRSLEVTWLVESEEEKEEEGCEKLFTSLQVQHPTKTSLSTNEQVQTVDMVPTSSSSVVHKMEMLPTSSSSVVQKKEMLPTSSSSVVQKMEMVPISQSTSFTNENHEAFLAALAKALGHQVDDCAEAYVGGTSPDLVTSAVTELKKLLEMKLHELVHPERLKEAAELTNLLEKEKKHFSEEQTSCLMLLKNLEQLGSSFQECEKLIAEATNALNVRKGLEGNLNKAYDELNEVSKQFKEVSAENEETHNFLDEVHQQIEEEENKLKGLKDKEKSLSEKVKMQQEDLNSLSQRQNDLCNATQPLLIEYKSQTEEKIRNDLNLAEKNKADVGRYYEELQTSFLLAFPLARGEEVDVKLTKR